MMKHNSTSISSTSTNRNNEVFLSSVNVPEDCFNSNIVDSNNHYIEVRATLLGHYGDGSIMVNIYYNSLSPYVVQIIDWKKFNEAVENLVNEYFTDNE